MEATLNIQVGDWPLLVMDSDGMLRRPTAAEQYGDKERRILAAIATGDIAAIRRQFDHEENMERLEA